MTRRRLVLSSAALLIVTLGLGFAWGASGRLAVERTLDDVRQQLDLAETRGHILEARVSLYNNNFGDASRNLENAKIPLRRIRERYQQHGRNAAAGSIAAALAHVEEAQRLAGKLDGAANSRANDALEAIRVASTQ
ncbi:MAG TPA: hypothetical protein VD833_08805 [Vicinamibacterales bacterium]|nr:hypothetical protein [Vicinamibacterales bacterium]